MKRIFLTSCLLFMALFFNSCSSDDDSGGIVNNNNYFPLVVGNSWEFSNFFTSSNQDDFSGTETLSVSGTEEQSGRTVYQMESSNPENSGLSTLIFRQGVLYKNNSSLLYTGNFGLDLPEFSNIEFDLQNVTVYNKNAAPDTEMSKIERSFEEQFEEFPLTFNFVIRTEMGENLDTMSVNGVTYEDVISSKWLIDLEVLTSVGPVSIPVVDNQRVTEVTNYFAKDIGLIKSESSTTLVFESISELPLEDISSETSQELINHNVSLD